MQIFVLIILPRSQSHWLHFGLVTWKSNFRLEIKSVLILIIYIYPNQPLTKMIFLANYFAIKTNKQFNNSQFVVLCCYKKTQHISPFFVFFVSYCDQSLLFCGSISLEMFKYLMENALKVGQEQIAYEIQLFPKIVSHNLLSI